jgi:3-oxoacyl-[acyl-carrier protein] reductase
MKGKTALVTGAANGIGAEIARLFSEQGARIWLLDKDEKQLESMTHSLKQQGAQADMCVADLTNPREIEAAISQIHKQINGLDVLVNNAGIYPRRQFLEMEEPDWLNVLDVNLNGAYRCTRLVVPQMVQRRKGKVIHISSVTFHWGLKHLTHYIAAKGGLVGFTRALARELGEFNIHGNCITPGAILTDKEAQTVTPDQAAATVGLQSLQRRIVPLDIARVCVFLGTEWSDGMTGQTLNVDGGWVMH